MHIEGAHHNPSRWQKIKDTVSQWLNKLIGRISLIRIRIFTGHYASGKPKIHKVKMKKHPAFYRVENHLGQSTVITSQQWDKMMATPGLNSEGFAMLLAAQPVNAKEETVIMYRVDGQLLNSAEYDALAETDFPKFMSAEEISIKKLVATGGHQRHSIRATDGLAWTEAV